MTLHVTKKRGFIQVGIIEQGVLTDDEMDIVIQTALKQFNNYSKFRDPLEIRQVEVTYEKEPGQSAWVDFSHNVDFTPINNRVLTNAD